MQNRFDGSVARLRQTRRTTIVGTCPVVQCIDIGRFVVLLFVEGNVVIASWYRREYLGRTIQQILSIMMIREKIPRSIVSPCAWLFVRALIFSPWRKEASALERQRSHLFVANPQKGIEEEEEEEEATGNDPFIQMTQYDGGMMRCSSCEYTKKIPSGVNGKI